MTTPLTKEYVAKIFEGLEGDGMGHAAFGQHLADDLQWTIKGTHPLAGTYSSKKAFTVTPLILRWSSLGSLF